MRRRVIEQNNIENGRKQNRAQKNKKIKQYKGNSKGELSEKKKTYVKIRNRIIIFIYIIFCIYACIKYFSWKGLVVPMMKNECSSVVDSDGNLIEKIGGEKKKSNLKLSEMPNNLKNAYIDIEDERFYSHKGIDVKRTSAAIVTYVTHGGNSSFGGSTITQQLVKNLTGNDSNTISRKVDEWVKAHELETFCKKDEILETYLNIIYVAPNTYGVELGAKYYFDKNVQDLNLAECAFLAGINNSPNSYNPFSDKDNSEKCKKRTKAVLSKMLEKKDITNEEYNNAIEEVDKGLKFKNGEITSESNGIYSYHTDALISEVISDLASKKHISTTFANNYIYMAGLTIYSTQKKDIQKELEAEYAKKKYIITSQNGNKSQSAMVIINQSNGQVVGCVGALGEKTTSRGFNRATQALRQTGSSIKPIAVLAPGIDKKLFTASTMYNDEATTFNDGSDTGYSPTDNDDYIGNITVRRAVESSQNIPFVKMMEAITPKESINYLKKMGITSLTNKDESLSLALGGLDKGITPLEMAAAYAAIANNGEYIEPIFYTKIVSSNGHKVIKSKQKKRRVFSKEVAYILKELLKQPVEGKNGTAQICAISGMDVAAKTGTTNENYDKWLCGFTTYYTAVTWYGYDINESIDYKGRSPAASLWSAVMSNIHSNLSKTKFEKPNGIKEAVICAKTGNVANSNCQNTYTEYFLAGTLPSQCVGCNSANKNNNTKTTNNAVKNTTKNTEIINDTKQNTKDNDILKNEVNNTVKDNKINENYNKIQENNNIHEENKINNQNKYNNKISQNSTTHNSTTIDNNENNKTKNEINNNEINDTYIDYGP